MGGKFKAPAGSRCFAEEQHFRLPLPSHVCLFIPSPPPSKNSPPSSCFFLRSSLSSLPLLYFSSPSFFPPLTLFTPRSSSPFPLLFSIFHSVGPPDSPQTLHPALSVSASRSSFFITRASLSDLTDIDQDAAAGMLSCCKFVQRGRVEKERKKNNPPTSKQGLEHGALKRQPLVWDRQLLSADQQISARIKKPFPISTPFLSSCSRLLLTLPPSFSLSKMTLPQMFNSSYLLIKRLSKLSIDVKASIWICNHPLRCGCCAQRNFLFGFSDSRLKERTGSSPLWVEREERKDFYRTSGSREVRVCKKDLGLFICADKESKNI